ncbi:hypothetical protein [Oceanobacillus alkalisoli]|uniref:hypothetical protein n=1 Tax=Oceanobacillus alkalisoli TaxID=2925113 RepID=UPI001EE42B9E|nr:hypothetical protein [Oceanobacillus alkalisoli]MCG5103062.1 hypothetical protein [Oceanobacillus alkalisoli]
MSTFKRLSLLLLVGLLIISVIDDLSKQQTTNEDNRIEVRNDKDVDIAHIKIEAGDTVLSVTEEINTFDYLDIEQIKEDFAMLNPGVDADSLVPSSFYYFPLYNEP